MDYKEGAKVALGLLVAANVSVRAAAALTFTALIAGGIGSQNAAGALPPEVRGTWPRARATPTTFQVLLNGPQR